MRLSYLYFSHLIPTKRIIRDKRIERMMKKKATARINDRGRVVIPEAVREALNLRDGDLVDLEVEKSKTSQSSNIGDDAGNHKPAPPKIKNR